MTKAHGDTLTRPRRPTPRRSSLKTAPIRGLTVHDEAAGSTHDEAGGFRSSPSLAVVNARTGPDFTARLRSRAALEPRVCTIVA